MEKIHDNDRLIIEYFINQLKTDIKELEGQYNPEHRDIIDNTVDLEFYCRLIKNAAGHLKDISERISKEYLDSLPSALEILANRHNF